ncbi:glutathione S-transferase family protein [Allorhizobium sp. BGMRC 0089]|uniref:glutathione S-transferase family protein n=1 Tax=Allorhizobium sonneratiae TaxID=2934936 RepID=UPI00203377E4|nr:glutathione S-transferase family protein [Allorhizobium sonneratiae]MCM2292240.1 glutathione S-transferase family protein [Allorhizobium sonneratiae]
MSDEVILYTNPMSRGRIVRWMLEEIGKPYKTEWVTYGPQMKSPDYLAINPLGKVPAISHKGAVVTETPAILAYLADAFPEAGLAPALDARASYYRWLFFMAGPMEAAAVNGACGFSVPDEKRGMMGYVDHKGMFDVIEAAIKASPFIAGDSFSAADIYMASHLNFQMHMLGAEKRAVLVDYAKRMTDRDAFRRASAIDAEAMEAAKA